MAILYQTVCGMLLSVTFVTFVTAAPDAKQAFEKYIKEPAGWGISLRAIVGPFFFTPWPKDGFCRGSMVPGNQGL